MFLLPWTFGFVTGPAAGIALRRAAMTAAATCLVSAAFAAAALSAAAFALAEEETGRAEASTTGFGAGALLLAAFMSCAFVPGDFVSAALAGTGAFEGAAAFMALAFVLASLAATGFDVIALTPDLTLGLALDLATSATWALLPAGAVLAETFLLGTELTFVRDGAAVARFTAETAFAGLVAEAFETGAFRAVAFGAVGF